MSNSINENQYFDYNNQNTTAQQAKIEQKLKYLGIPEDIIKQGPNAVIQYAKENSIALSMPDEDQKLQETSIFDMDKNSDTNTDS